MLRSRMTVLSARVPQPPSGKTNADVGTLKLSTRSKLMRYILGIILVFGFLAWDIAANGGHFTHLAVDTLDDLARQLRSLW
jgi:hypothetical protein